MENQAVETKPKRMSVIMETDKPKLSRKEELQAKMKKEGNHLPPAEYKELQAILQAEELERKKGALRHKLCERVDSYGRKEASKIRRQITDRVAGFSSQKASELKSIEDIYKESVKDLDKASKKAMQEIQEAHNKRASELRKGRDSRAQEVSKKYQDQYDEAEMEMEDSIEEVGKKVVEFQGFLDNLTLEELQELEKGGTLKITRENGDEEFLVVPGQEA